MIVIRESRADRGREVARRCRRAPWATSCPRRSRRSGSCCARGAWRTRERARRDLLPARVPRAHAACAWRGPQIADYQRLWDEDGFANWAACERETGRLIGRIGLLRHDDWPLVDEPGRGGLDARSRATGAAASRPRAGRRPIDAWREHLPDETLYSFTVPQNTRSRAVMERLGMRFGGPRSGTGSSTSGTRSTASEAA